jgi:hypothetical protein
MPGQRVEVFLRNVGDMHPLILKVKSVVVVTTMLGEQSAFSHRFLKPCTNYAMAGAEKKTLVEEGSGGNDCVATYYGGA